MKCALRLALRRSRIALQRDANEPMRNTHILAYDGCRHALLPLFRLADESEAHVRSYYKIGHVLVARMEGSIIGMVQILEEEETAEIVSLAVIPERQQQGVGTRLLQEAANHSRGWIHPPTYRLHGGMGSGQHCILHETRVSHFQRSARFFHPRERL